MSACDPRVGVSVLTHNRHVEVTRTVERLRALPTRPPIVVVDNGSTDGTAARLARRFPDLDVIRLCRNVGAAGRNVGVEHLRTPYVALSDDDTWWAPDALARAADALDRHPALAVITARVLVGAEDREDAACRAMAASPLPRPPGLPGVPVLGFLAGASVFRRTAYLEIGGFDERLFLGGEERLFALDLAAAGWHLAYLPDVVAHHHPSRLRKASARRRLLARNELWVAWLRRPGRTALRETIDTLSGALRDPARLAGCLEALGGVGWILRERRVVPEVVERHLQEIA